ncbi:MAG TPA: SDR family NAD(P)-dependent oxidoreductase [Ktedonobacterales bacterium]|nr:SDR family NAD(P)-dependent oxidoreductase [Ktedonobacterales bacterium]
MTSSSPTALITGASRGLGLALARELALHNWTLIIDARGADALETATNELSALTQVTAIPGDVTDSEHRKALVQAAHEAGGIDVLVNNASILGPSPQPALLDYPLDVLAEVYRTNVIAPLALIQAMRHELRPHARIINITSDAAVEPYAGWGGYGSGKAALEQLSNILAAELPEYGVYWVDPGDMRTELHQLAFPGEDISDRPLPEESVPGLLTLLAGDLPSGRYQARRLADTANDDIATAGVRELRVALTVENFEQAVAVYRDGLRLPVVKEWSAPEGRGLILGAGRGTIELLDRADAEHTDAVEAGARVAGPVRLALEVPDVAQAAASLAAHGARALRDPVHTTWGNYTQRVQAPDGMQLSLYTPESAPEGQE